MAGRKERCETCRFWAQIDEDFGDCRRFPPVLPTKAVMVSLGLIEPYEGVFPSTLPGTWCGEWQAVGPDTEG